MSRSMACIWLGSRALACLATKRVVLQQSYYVILCFKAMSTQVNKLPVPTKEEDEVASDIHIVSNTCLAIWWRQVSRLVRPSRIWVTHMPNKSLWTHLMEKQEQVWHLKQEKLEIKHMIDDIASILKIQPLRRRKRWGKKLSQWLRQYLLWMLWMANLTDMLKSQWKLPWNKCTRQNPYRITVVLASTCRILSRTKPCQH